MSKIRDIIKQFINRLFVAPEPEPTIWCSVCHERPADAGGFLWKFCSECAEKYPELREKDLELLGMGINRIRERDSSLLLKLKKRNPSSDRFGYFLWHDKALLEMKWGG